MIYVLAPTREDFERAQRDTKDFPWAKPIMIPTTFYLESVMYTTILQRRRTEWEHAEYVGTIAHTAVQKLYDLSGIYDTLRHASNEHGDVAAFLYRGDSLLAAAEKWHPGFLRIWAASLRYLGFPLDKVMSEEIPSYYCNYWAATPETMKDYIQFFKSFTHALETLPFVSDEVWNDSSYSGRGPDIAGLSSDQCMKIWGVEHYPFHPFVCERIPCFFFWVTGRKLIASTC